MPATVLVWDLAVRVFHWSLIASILAAYMTSDGLGKIHRLAGYTAVSLLVFRVVWGFVGTKHAQFTDFVRPPASVLAYIRDILRGHAKRSLGHNPAGGAMILALLAVVTGIGTTGLMMESTRFFGSDWVETGHKLLVYSLFVLVPLHVLGVILSSRSHRENLTASMITGRKPMQGTDGEVEAQRRELDTRLRATNGLALAALVAVLLLVGWPQVRAQLDVLEKRKAVAAAAMTSKGTAIETRSTTVQTTAAIATAPIVPPEKVTEPSQNTLATKAGATASTVLSTAQGPAGTADIPKATAAPAGAISTETFATIATTETNAEHVPAATSQIALDLALQHTLREFASSTRPAALAMPAPAVLASSAPDGVSTEAVAQLSAGSRAIARLQISQAGSPARRPMRSATVTRRSRQTRRLQERHRTQPMRTAAATVRPVLRVQSKAARRALKKPKPQILASKFVAATARKAGKGPGRGRGRGRGGSSGKGRGGGSNSGHGSSNSGKGSSGSGSGGSSGKGSGGGSSGSGGGHGSSGSGGD